MKTQIKRFSKSTLAVVLTLCMIFSCMTVGIIATDAAKVESESVGDNAVTFYIYPADLWSDYASYTIKANANIGDNNTWRQYDFTDTGKTIKGKVVYEVTIQEKYGGVDALQIQKYDGSTWKAQYQPYSSWTNSSNFSGKIYNGSTWVDRPDWDTVSSGYYLHIGTSNNPTTWSHYLNSEDMDFTITPSDVGVSSFGNGNYYVGISSSNSVTNMYSQGSNNTSKVTVINGGGLSGFGTEGSVNASGHDYNMARFSLSNGSVSSVTVSVTNSGDNTTYTITAQGSTPSVGAKIKGITGDWNNYIDMTQSGSYYYYEVSGDDNDKYFRYKVGDTTYEAYTNDFNLLTDGDYHPYDGTTANKKYGSHNGDGNAFKF